MYNVKYNVLLLLNIWLKSIISLSSCPRCILGYILKLICDVIFFTTYLKNLGYNIKIIAFYDSTWYVVHKNLHSPIYLWFTLISASNSLFAALKRLLKCPLTSWWHLYKAVVLNPVLEAPCPAHILPHQTHLMQSLLPSDELNQVC